MTTNRGPVAIPREVYEEANRLSMDAEELFRERERDENRPPLTTEERMLEEEEARDE